MTNEKCKLCEHRDEDKFEEIPCKYCSWYHETGSDLFQDRDPAIIDEEDTYYFDDSTGLYRYLDTDEVYEGEEYDPRFMAGSNYKSAKERSLE